MKVLVLFARQNEAEELADGLSGYGYEVTAAGATWGKKHHIGYLTGAVKLIYREASKCQLIILDGTFYDTLVARTIRKLKGVPLVLYLRGYFPVEVKEDANNKAAQKLSWLLKSHLIKNSAHIVYVSQWLRDKYLNNPRLSTLLKDKPSTIIHLAPDLFFHPGSTETYLKPGKELILCYAGKFSYLDKVKGILLLFDAYDKLLKTFLGLRLCICADGRHRQLIEERINELNLGDKVVLTGKVGWSELREYYRRAYIFVYPSFLDCSPKTVKEAQACGAPAVVTNSSGAAELIVNGVTGIVCQPTVESLVESITYLINNPDVRHSMSIQAAEHIRHNLSWEVTAAKFNEVITSLNHSTINKGKN